MAMSYDFYRCSRCHVSYFLPWIAADDEHDRPEVNCTIVHVGGGFGAMTACGGRVDHIKRVALDSPWEVG